MLRVPEDSGSLRKLVEEAEEWASSRAGILSSFLGEAGETVISYSGRGLIPSRILYWSLVALTPRTPLYVDSEAAAYHVVPYREGLRLVVLSPEGPEPSVYRLLDAARLTGHRVLLVSGMPPERLAHKVEGHMHIVLPGNVDPILASSLLAFKAGVSLASHPGRLRASRLRGEALDVSSIVDGLLEAYRGKLVELRDLVSQGPPLYVAYTPMMEAPAFLLADLLRSRGIPAILLPAHLAASRTPAASRLILLYTSVEGFVAREISSRTAMLDSSVEGVELRTDPVSAQIYGVILVYAFSSMLRM